MFLSKRMKSIGIPSCALLPLPEKGIYLPRFTLISCSLTKKKYRPHYKKAFTFLLTNYPSHSPLPGTSSLLQPPPPLPPSLQPHSHSPLQPPPSTPTHPAQLECTWWCPCRARWRPCSSGSRRPFSERPGWRGTRWGGPGKRGNRLGSVCLPVCLWCVWSRRGINMCGGGGNGCVVVPFSFLLCIDDNVRFYFHAMRGMVNAFISLCIL